eukprot:6884870-Pyramimonas_sp.AAC.1
MELAAYQHSRGKWLLFEHPWTASSWKEECIKNIREPPGVIVAKGSQCVFGAKSHLSLIHISEPTRPEPI